MKEVKEERLKEICDMLQSKTNLEFTISQKPLYPCSIHREIERWRENFKEKFFIDIYPTDNNEWRIYVFYRAPKSINYSLINIFYAENDEQLINLIIDIVEGKADLNAPYNKEHIWKIAKELKIFPISKTELAYELLLTNDITLGEKFHSEQIDNLYGEKFQLQVPIPYPNANKPTIPIFLRVRKVVVKFWENFTKGENEIVLSVNIRYQFQNSDYTIATEWIIKKQQGNIWKLYKGEANPFDKIYYYQALANAIASHMQGSILSVNFYEEVQV